MKKVFMWSWTNDSDAGKELADALGIKRIRHTGSTFTGGPGIVVINWGSSGPPQSVRNSKVINKTEAVAKSINKISFFRATEGKARTVPWTTSKAEALAWGTKVVCRTQVKGREGAGILLYSPQEALGSPPVGIWGWLATTLPATVFASVASNMGLPEAKLYTKFIQATEEYRVHVIDGETVAVHRKVQQDGSTGGCDVKNTANGWLFRRVSHYPGDVARQAVKAVKALELDFAAVDVIWDGTQGWVLETNTAPGIETMTWTIDRYRQGLQKLIDKA